MADEVEIEIPQRALDVLAGVLREPYGDEDVEREAEQWETDNGQILLRPWEIGPDGMPNEKFIARAATFKTRALPDIEGDPRIFKAELDRLVEGIDDPQNISPALRTRVNELETALGRAQTDFAKARSRKQIVEDSKKNYALYAAQNDFSKRIVMVKREKDIPTLHLLIKYDKAEVVREAATKRLAEIEVTGV